LCETINGHFIHDRMSRRLSTVYARGLKSAAERPGINKLLQMSLADRAEYSRLDPARVNDVDTVEWLLAPREGTNYIYRHWTADMICEVSHIALDTKDDYYKRLATLRLFEYRRIWVIRNLSEYK
jgi:hypothetical protein